MAEDVKIGKSYRRQKFMPVRTPESVAADAALHAKFADPDAMPLSAYFVRRGITDPVKQAGMAAYTRLRAATLSAWDSIFASY
jgi:hypothetical protein